MWRRRRHHAEHTTSPPVPEATLPSPEARKALDTAHAAQRDVARKKAELAPLLAEIRQHLRENDITRTVQAVVTPRRTT